MINKERVELLCQALESGEYPQCFGMLTFSNDGYDQFCVEGVAIEVAAAHGITVTFESVLSGMPTEVAQWYGFEGQSKRVVDLTQEDLVHSQSSKNYLEVALILSAGRAGLIAANDYYRLPFKIIAQAIRRTYLDES